MILPGVVASQQSVAAPRYWVYLMHWTSNPGYPNSVEYSSNPGNPGSQGAIDNVSYYISIQLPADNYPIGTYGQVHDSYWDVYYTFQVQEV